MGEETRAGTEKRGWLARRVPSPYEALSLLVAMGALLVSFFGYRLSNDTENALRENLQVSCQQIDRQIAYSPPVAGKSPARIVITGRARVYNNSRSSISYARTYVEVTGGTLADNESITFPGATKQKFGADRPLGDEGVFLEAGKSTTIGFSVDLGIPPDAAAGLRSARPKTIREANTLLQGSGIDLFGDPLIQLGPNTTSPHPATYEKYPNVRFYVETNRPITFGDNCSFFDGFDQF
jgi:hypothetical protein